MIMSFYTTVTNLKALIQEGKKSLTCNIFFYKDCVSVTLLKSDVKLIDR